ncbi:MAG: iron-containing alcohol dehydrogenase [Bacteroidales bacterium]|jgi:alcohol dehydrogenase class IV|nr:iron-containing alcohol dehydrogenase [Bacteroidales bacterium]
MVKSFRLARMPHIIFRAGAVRDLPDQAVGYGGRILLVTGVRSFTESPQALRLREQLAALGVEMHQVTVTGEPSPVTVDEAVSNLKGAGITLVAGIGGGSVMDAGKAISAMLTVGGSVTDYLEVVGSREHPGTKVPFIAVPTTSGTGSEATKNAVISQVGKGGFKRSLRHDNFVPDVALIDPELTLNCPPDITAAAGMDCFTQLAEAYLSTKSNEFTDALALQGMEAIKRSLVRSYTDGDDINARSDMSFAALMSGICLANAGLGAVHGLAGTIGALHEIPHGAVCGTLMAAANKINVRELRRLSQAGSEAVKNTGPEISASLEKYATLGRLFADAARKNNDWYIDFFIDFLFALTYRLSLPRLGTFGLEKDNIADIVSQSDVKNNPVNLSFDQRAEIIFGRL